MKKEITDLRKSLTFSEQQARSFEDSLKKAAVELEVKEDYFQEESARRLDEAKRWEHRLQKLNSESKDLYEENKEKEIELIRSKKIHMTLLEKLQASDEQVKQHEANIEIFRI